MKSVPRLVTSMAIVIVMTIGQVSAQSAATSTDEKTKEACPISEALTNLPQMVYQVGDETTCCSESAAALAKKHDQPLKFVVAKKTFDDKTAAYTALVEETESFVNDFVTPTKCEVSGTTSIAGKSCACAVQAGQMADMVKKATDAVHITYQVGEETCHCPVEAANMAKQSGEATQYIVAGETTGCELTARLNLARAKYKAAVETMVQAEKQAKANAEKEGDS